MQCQRSSSLAPSWQNGRRGGQLHTFHGQPGFTKRFLLTLTVITGVVPKFDFGGVWSLWVYVSLDNDAILNETWSRSHASHCCKFRRSPCALNVIKVVVDPHVSQFYLSRCLDYKKGRTCREIVDSFSILNTGKTATAMGTWSSVMFSVSNSCHKL